jgi:hypothetical protein
LNRCVYFVKQGRSSGKCPTVTVTNTKVDDGTNLEFLDDNFQSFAQAAQEAREEGSSSNPRGLLMSEVILNSKQTVKSSNSRA